MKKIKKRYIAIAIVLVVVLILGFVSYTMGSPLTRDKVKDKIEKQLNNTVKNKDITSIILTIHSDKNKFSETFTAGVTGEDKRIVKSDHPYLIASVTKTFTAALFGILYDKGLINYNDQISKYLDSEILERLFIYEGMDYKNIVTIEQLLNHTSGVADYFDGPVLSGSTMKELFISDPYRVWTPLDAIEFTRNNQVSIGKPGMQMYYSDTGYQLLGLILENVTNTSYSDFLHNTILVPLGMKSTSVMFYSEPQKKYSSNILELWMNGYDLSKTNALSISWADGGMISTTEDLLIFYKALNNMEIVSESVLNRMKDFHLKYIDGVYYGSGMMEFRLNEFSALLPEMPNIHGGVGSSGSFMMYDETNDTYIIGNFGSTNFMNGSVAQILQTLLVYSRMVI